MIHHTYTSSVISLRTSLSFNDYTYCSNERCPSSYCSCCCSFSINSPRYIVPINPSFLYGLRQSTLIQCPPLRRLIMGSVDRYCFRAPVSDVGRCCNGECCCVKREGVDRFLGKCCKEKCCDKKLSVDKVRGRIGRHNYRCSAIGDAEAMLSLLSEETFEDCLNVRERRRLSRDGNIVLKHNVVRGISKGKKEDLGSGYLGGRTSRHQLALGKIKSKDEVDERREERENLLKEERMLRSKESSSGNLGSRLDEVRAESSRLHLRNKDYKRREDMEKFSKEEERWSRRFESSSSCYSASDRSDLESDTEAEIKDQRYVAESSTRHEKDSRKFGGVVISEENKKELRRYRDQRDEQLQSTEHVNSKVESSAVFDSRKKLEGIVINEEETKKGSKRYIDDENQELQSSRRGESRLGSSAEWDWRKKSEKRLTEESTEEMKARKYSVVRHSQMSQAQESSSMRASRSEKQFDDQEEGSISGLSSRGQLRSRVKKDHQVSEYSKYSARHEQSTQTTRYNVDTTSNVQRRSNQGEEGMMVVGQSEQGTGCEYCKTCGRTMQQNKTQTDSQKRIELSQNCEDMRSTSGVQGHLESRLEKPKSSTSLQSSVQQKDEQCNQMTHVVADQVETRRKLQHYGETVDTHDKYVESSLSSHQQSETRMQTSEGNSSSLISRQEVKELLRKSEGKVIKETGSTSVAQTAVSALQTHSSNVEINRLSVSEQNIYNELIYSTKGKSEEELVQKRKYIDETIVRSRIRTEVLQPIIEAVYTGNFSGEASASQPSMALTSHTGAQQLSEGEANIALQISTTPPSGDSLSSSGKNDFGGIAQVGTSIVYVHPQGKTSSTSDEVSSVMESYGEASHEDAIGSAERMEESSICIVGGFVEEMRHEGSNSQTRAERPPPQQDSKHQIGTSSLYVDPGSRTPSSSDEVICNRMESFEEPSHEYALVSAEGMGESAVQIVGKFVEKIQHEASTSQSSILEKPSQLDARLQDEKYMLKGSSQSHSENTIIQKQESRRSSGASETKGPSDEMWDAKDHFGQDSSEVESSNSVISENVSVRRTGKSLWNLVAGIFRVLHAESQKSSIKEDADGSSDESASDEPWSSEEEVDEDSPKGAGLPEDPTSSVQPLQRRASSKSQREDLGAMILDERMGGVEVDVSSSLSILPTGLLSGGASCGSGGNTNWNVAQQMLQPTPAGVPEDLTSSVQPLRRRASLKSQREDIGAMILDDQMGLDEVGASSSSSILLTGLLSGGVSSGVNTNWNVIQQMSQSTPSDLMEPPAERLRRSHGSEEIEEAGLNEGLIKSTGQQGAQSIDEMQARLKPASGVTDADARKGKLQRSNQVLNERYDEWETAYRREREQRKVDEIFMREALVEAKKAADSWEVPVGAVLVQNGNVIARGYNLVEELRDSTAHAEMICIREASNVLQTWRLSETTLYVTLEPCPMCAGAILQARVGTLVWGAPNKLLGADGSWIRLFRECVEGEERPEVAEKPAAPMHPFHPNMKIRRGVLEAECADIMQQFFHLRRRKEKKAESSQKPKLLQKILKFPATHKKH